MEKKKLIQIAVRIYALYLIIQIPIALWAIISVFAVDTSKFVINPSLYKTWAIISPLLYFLIAMVLFSKAESISTFIIGKHETNDSQSDVKPPSYSRLSFWITLLGLYLLVSSISSIIGELIRFPIHVRDTYMWSIVIPKGIMIIAAYYMTFKSQKVERIILRKLEGKQLTSASTGSPINSAPGEPHS